MNTPTPKTDAIRRDVMAGKWSLTEKDGLLDKLEGFERELSASQAGQAELLARLEDRTQSHLVASARDVQTIQQQAVELAKWQALAEGLAGALDGCVTSLSGWQSVYERQVGADDKAIFEAGEAALAAYEAAKVGGAARKSASPLDEPPGPA